ncbi:MAG: GDSL-type esterase/lipase family protein [Litorilinea sp.]
MQIVAFGDSTTAARFPLQVYAERLHAALLEMGKSVGVVNAGARGDHTRGARARLAADVIARQPQLVLIQFGINDAAVDVWKTPPVRTPRISLAEYEENLAAMVTELHAYAITPVLMTPNPLAWTPQLRLLYRHAPYDPATHAGFNVVLDQYVARVCELAVATQTLCIDINRAFRAWQPNTATSSEGTATDEAYSALLLDGMHPNDRGHTLIADTVLAALAENALI